MVQNSIPILNLVASLFGQFLPIRVGRPAETAWGLWIQGFWDNPETLHHSTYFAERWGEGVILREAGENSFIWRKKIDYLAWKSEKISITADIINKASLISKIRSQKK